MFWQDVQIDSPSPCLTAPILMITICWQALVVLIIVGLSQLFKSSLIHLRACGWDELVSCLEIKLLLNATRSKSLSKIIHFSQQHYHNCDHGHDHDHGLDHDHDQLPWPWPMTMAATVRGSRTITLNIHYHHHHELQKSEQNSSFSPKLPPQSINHQRHHNHYCTVYHHAKFKDLY